MLNRAATILWIVVLAMGGLWVAFRAWQAPVIGADLLSMLPAAAQESDSARWGEMFRTRVERRVVFLFGAPSLTDAQRAWQRAHDDLQASGQFVHLSPRQPDRPMEDVLDFYIPRRFGLLTDRTRERLERGEHDLVLRDIPRAYFDPVAPLVSSIVEVDPFLFLSRYVANLGGPASGAVAVEDGLVTVRADGRVHVLLSATLSDSPFSFTLQDRLRRVLDALGRVDAGYPDGTSVLRSGVLFHAMAGRDSAHGEISTVGLGALAGIIFMYIAVFRSARPLVLSLLSVATGCLGGFVACVIAFGQVHMLTLVFGASLVGISIDYSLHYFCARFPSQGDGGPTGAIRRVLPAMSLGLVTSVAGFAGLLVLGFPGLRQVGLFSGVGLICAYLVVISLHPRLDRTTRAPTPAGLLERVGGALNFVQRYQGRYVWGAALVLAVGLSGLLRVHAVDDIRQLQPADPQVLAEDRKVRDLLGEDVASQFFLVLADNTGQLLERQEKLVALLAQAEADGAIADHIAFSDFVPSSARQAESHTLLGEFLHDRSADLQRIGADLGLPDVLLERYLSDFEVGRLGGEDSLVRWLQTPMARPFRDLWLGQMGSQVAAVVGLSGVRDTQALAALQGRVDGVTFVDRVDALSRAFAELRAEAQMLILVACAVITVILVMRYGVVGGVAVAAAPVTAVVASLGLQGWLGEPQSIFNVMALLLVLGIGVDFGIFMREAGREAASTLLAVALSALTSILAFGLLALSATASVHGFGLTVFIGVVVAFLLCPLASVPAPRRRVRQ